jgi:tetratricopeptide (TPR) repeat protein
VSGQVMMAKSDGAGAIRDLDRALELNASNLEALRARLAVDLHFKKTQEGRSRLDRAIKQNPNNADLLLLAARFEQSAGDNAAAEKYLRTTLEKDASNLAAYTSLGQMYFQQRRLDEARHEFEEIVKRKPDSVPARTMVGMILDVQQKHEESKKIYEGIVTGGVRAPVAANNLAWIYANRGEQLDLALQLAQDAKQQMPDSAEVNDTLGWVYYKKDLRELAVKTLENSVGKDPKNVMFQYHLGLAYAKAGQTMKARHALEEALRLKPDFDGADEARKTLASLKG